MPLVDYASSGEESEEESNQTDEVASVENKEFLNKQSQKVNSLENKNIDGNTSLFSSLPTPIVNVSLLTDNNKLSNLLLNKKINLTKKQKNEKQSVKISVPSISEFNENDQPALKKRKPSVKGVGLFSVLPPPKNFSSKESVKTFIPHSIKKPLSKPNSKVNVKIEITKSVPSTSNESDEDDEETLVGSSFFGSSLNSSSVNLRSSTSGETVSEMDTVTTNSIEPKMEPINQLSDWIVHNPEENISKIELPVKEETSNMSIENSQSVNEISPDEINPLELDEKALQILCGNKKKRQQMSMNIIDLSGEEIMPDSKEWLLKQLSQEKRGRIHSHRKHDGPSSQSRRKHQITYLAFQAKEQELELQNQWANNRMSRRQTQSKYGF